MVIAGLALLLEFSVFSSEHWFIDLCLFAQLTLVTINLCLNLLHPDTQVFWLKYRIWCVYIPFGIVIVLTILEFALFGSLIYDHISAQFSDE